MAYQDRPRSPKPTKAARKAQSERDREIARQQRLSDGAERTSKLGKPKTSSVPWLSPEEHGVRYKKYIGGKVWLRRRLAYYAKHPKVCRACEGIEKMHLHHMSYDRAYTGQEPDSDLMPLCEFCHDQVHTLHRSAAGQMTLRAVTRLVIERSGGTWAEPKRKRVKPARKRSAPAPPPGRKDPVNQAIAAKRKARRDKGGWKAPDPRPLPMRLRDGDRVVIVIKEDNKALTWARGRTGTLRHSADIPSAPWYVEFDGLPSSHFSVTPRMVKLVSRQATNR